jgi:hypothetical protein
MELNLVALLYLFFRLAPFIIVCYFSLSSLFNQDIKGLIYLVGLLLACFIAFLIGNSVESIGMMNSNMEPICNLITMGKDGSFSKVPLGLTIMTFTFIYLVYIIVKNSVVNSNIPTLIFFPLLIVSDFVWNLRNNCYQPLAIAIAIVIGAICGWFWAAIISSLKSPNLLFLNIGSDKAVCSRPSKQLFKCTFPKPQK